MDTVYAIRLCRVSRAGLKDIVTTSLVHVSVLRCQHLKLPTESKGEIVGKRCLFLEGVHSVSFLKVLKWFFWVCLEIPVKETGSIEIENNSICTIYNLKVCGSCFSEKTNVFLLPYGWAYSWWTQTLSNSLWIEIAQDLNWTRMLKLCSNNAVKQKALE